MTDKDLRNAGWDPDNEPCIHTWKRRALTAESKWDSTLEVVEAITKKFESEADKFDAEASTFTMGSNKDRAVHKELEKLLDWMKSVDASEANCEIRKPN